MKINDKYYTEKLKYEVGEIVILDGKEHKIVHIHEDGFVNLEDGISYIFQVHPNMLHKKQRSIYSKCKFGCKNMPLLNG